MKRIAAANWRLASARPALPPVELVHHEALETQDFIEYAFGGGALRLFVSAGRKGGDIFAMLVDTHEPRYADFAQLVPTARYGTYTGGTYVVVVPVRPLSHELFDKLKARRWTENELEQRLGTPSYRWHVHGIGFWGLTYVSQGLSFIGDQRRRGGPKLYQVSNRDVEENWEKEPEYRYDLPPLARLSGLDYAELQRDCRDELAYELLRQRQEIERAVARGKRSPDGRFVVGHVNLGGLANTEEVVIREREKPERRYGAPHFTGDDDYLWLNAGTIVFKVMTSDWEFYTMDARTGAMKQVATADAHVADFGVTGPQRFWYKTDDGKRHKVTVERGKASAAR